MAKALEQWLAVVLELGKERSLGLALVQAWAWEMGHELAKEWAQ